MKTGGRGKAGGVKLADDPDDAKARAQDILGLDIKGHIIHKVLVAQASDIAEEYYFSFLLDRANRTFLAMASVEGGMDIEEVAVDQARGAGQHPGRRHARASTSEGRARSSTRRTSPPRCATRSSPIAVQLWEVFVEEDATLVEVNPLAKTPDGTVARARRQGHPRRQRRLPAPASTTQLEDIAPADPLEAAAKEKDLNYVKLDGEVGIIGNGAGLVMSTLDVVAYAGEEFGGVKPANFLDIGGGASARGHGQRAARSSWPTRT